MGKVRVRKETGRLQFDFFYRGLRCREQTLLEDTPVNRKRLEAFMAQIDAEIKQGTFAYERYFPNSSNLEKLAQPNPAFARVVDRPPSAAGSQGQTFREFAEEWHLENEISWKISAGRSMLTPGRMS